MEILFVSYTCTDKKYEEILRLRKKVALDPGQRWFHNLMRGLAADQNHMTALTSLPVSFSTVSKKFFHRETENEDGCIDYIYPSLFNGKIMRLVSFWFKTRRETNSWIRRTKGSSRILICDPILIPSSAVARRICKKHHIPTMAFITDYPEYAKYSSEMNGGIRGYLHSIYEKYTCGDIDRYDSYVFITEDMNTLINKSGKPYIIVEDSVNPEQLRERTQEEYGGKKRICIYAGGIYKNMGVNRLANAFINARCENTELHFYGAGPETETIKQLQKDHDNIKYMGCISQSELNEKLRNAKVLFNARPTDNLGNIYSFPSKTMVYMTSGTPTVTTRLRGIPRTYEDYLFWFDDESDKGLEEKIKSVLSMSDEALFNFGKRTQEYLKANKLYTEQGKKLSQHCKSVISEQKFFGKVSNVQ